MMGFVLTMRRRVTACFFALLQTGYSAGNERGVRNLYRGRRIQASGILTGRRLGLATRTRARLSFVLEAGRNQAGRNLDSLA